MIDIKKPGGLFSARVGAWLYYIKKMLWTTDKRGNSHGFVTLQFEKFSKICAITMGRKKTSLKHCYLHGLLTCPYFLCPENGVRFLKRFSFRCGIGRIFVALFVKSSFGTCTVNTSYSYITGLDMCKVCTEAVHSVALWTRVTSCLDMCKICTEAVHSVALWTRVPSQAWTCLKYVVKQSVP